MPLPQPKQKGITLGRNEKNDYLSVSNDRSICRALPSEGSASNTELTKEGLTSVQRRGNIILIMVKNHPWQQKDLDEYGRLYCASLRKSIKNYRRKRKPDSTKIDKWDIPRVVVACGSTTPPFVGVKAKNTSTLKKPHHTLYSSYPSVKNEMNPPTYPGEPHYQEGHCAEPHAAQKLLNEMDRKGVALNIPDISFGKAFSVCNGVEKPYCATCKLTFPQLR